VLEILTILVALSTNYSEPIDPLIGIWESAQEDSFEFRHGGTGNDYVKIIEAGLQYKWEKVGDRIEFTYPKDIPDRSCLFTINGSILTLSDCNIITSDLGYVLVWSGERVE